MSIFGWSYPPGCSNTPYDEEYPCQVCGKDGDDCVCPECPVCDEQGNPNCYPGKLVNRRHNHHITEYTEAQLEAQAEQEERDRLQAAADAAEAEYWAHPDRKREEEELHALMQEIKGE